MTNNKDFLVRQANISDINTLVRHRCEMFADMGRLPTVEMRAELETASLNYFQLAISKGDYRAWMVETVTQPAMILAGGGLQLRPILPFPDYAGKMITTGLQGLIVNVYTEQAWRRQGLARLLMNTIIEWSKTNKLASLILHASDMGRPLYEQLGFVGSNEMRFTKLS